MACKYTLSLVKLEINDQTDRAVQVYFDSIEKDVPNDRIALLLNEKGYRTLEGRKFTKSSLATWAANRKYKGDYVFDVSAPKDEDGKRNTNRRKPEEQQIIIPNAIPAIIQPDQWERVNQKLKAQKRKPGRTTLKTLLFRNY